MKLTFSWIAWLVGVVGMVMSWTVNKSVCWAIFHALFSGIYVPYWLIKYSGLCNWVYQWVVK